MSRFRRRTEEEQSLSKENGELKGRLFNKENFFNYIENELKLRTLTPEGLFNPGEIENLIVEYFESNIFPDPTFVYVPEFDRAIFELLQKYQDMLASFAPSMTRIVDESFTDDKKIKYLTLANSQFRKESTRSLSRQLMDIENAQRKRRNKFSERLKAKARKLKQETTRLTSRLQKNKIDSHS